MKLRRVVVAVGWMVVSSYCECGTKDAMSVTKPVGFDAGPPVKSLSQ